jgi:A/G-specific adenine glycosylase
MNSLFSVTLLRWFAANGRSLPWRERDDAYAIWLSEIILQQTRVEQGRDYWLRFMQRFPTVEALAAATEDEVLRLWQGLGYYSRARNLHAAARQVVAMGGFPRSVEGLRQLKGVGDYTAAAVASMAFNEPAAAVDGNVFRVLARHFGIATAINTTEGRREFTALAAELLPPREAGTFNQAMMDFGATLCTPRSPRCADCPFVETCVARREGRVEELPVKLRKTTIRERRLAYIYIRCKGDTAIHRRGAGDIWQGLWEPVEIESPSLTPPVGGRISPVEMESPCDYPVGDEGMGVLDNAILLAKDVKHVLTHRILLADFYFLDTPSRPPLPPDYIWIPESALDDYAKPRLIERLLEMGP